VGFELLPKALLWKQIEKSPKPSGANNQSNNTGHTKGCFLEKASFDHRGLSQEVLESLFRNLLIEPLRSAFHFGR